MRWGEWTAWWVSQGLSIAVVLMLFALVVLSGCQSAQPMGEELWRLPL